MIVMTSELELYCLSVLRVCAIACEVPLLTVLTFRKQRPQSMARAAFFRVTRPRLDLSYPELANIFGIHHSTVVVAAQKVPKELLQKVLDATADFPLPKVERIVKPKPPKPPGIRVCPNCGTDGCSFLRNQPGYRYCVTCRHRWPSMSKYRMAKGRNGAARRHAASL